MPIRGTPTPRLRRWDEARIYPKGRPKDLCFRTCPRRGAVSLPVTGPRLARPVSRRKGSRTASARRSRPLRRASLASRPTPRVGHIHSSRCRTTGSPEGERRPDQWPGDAPAGGAGGEFSMMRTGSKAKSVSLDRRPRSRSRGPWWSKTGSNRRPHACKARALPTELLPREHYGSASAGASRLVGLGRLELPTSRLSSARSNQLSYKPKRPDPRRTRRPIRWKKEKRRRRRPARWDRDLGPVIQVAPQDGSDPRVRRSMKGDP